MESSRLDTNKYNIEVKNEHFSVSYLSTEVIEDDLLENERAFYTIIRWLNNKIKKEYEMYERKVLTCDNYIESLRCKSNEDMINYYFHSGQLLAILYMLNCNNIGEDDITDNFNYPAIKSLVEPFKYAEEILNYSFSAENIANSILKNSVYNIYFISKGKEKLARKYLKLIKNGFEYTYNILIFNKTDLINLVKRLFNNNHLWLSSIIPKIYGLSESDLKRQLYFLDLRFSKKQVEKICINFSEDETFKILNKDHLIDLAIRLGDHIIQKGIIGVTNGITSRTWINGIEQGNDIKLSGKCYNLPQGNSGIALFLLYLGVVAKKDYFISSAVEAMQAFMEQICNYKSDEKFTVESFRDISGELYALSKIYYATKDSNIKIVIEKVICLIDANIKEYSNINFIEEVAEIIAVLISICEIKELQYLKDRAMYLCNLAYENIANSMDFQKIISSFSYKANKMIISLARFLDISKNKKVEDNIEVILSFQREIIINSQRCNSKYEELKLYKGMLLSRIVLKGANYNRDKLLDIEIRESINYIIKNAFGSSPYYNGDLESIDLLEYAAKVLKDDSLKNRCINTFSEVTRTVIEPYINAEINFENKSIALMTGVSGQGYSLIRRCSNSVVPQVLWLE